MYELIYACIIILFYFVIISSITTFIERWKSHNKKQLVKWFLIITFPFFAWRYFQKLFYNGLIYLYNWMDMFFHSSFYDKFYLLYLLVTSNGVLWELDHIVDEESVPWSFLHNSFPIILEVVDEVSLINGDISAWSEGVITDLITDGKTNEAWLWLADINDTASSLLSSACIATIHGVVSILSESHVSSGWLSGDWLSQVSQTRAILSMQSILNTHHVRSWEVTDSL